MRQGNDGIQLNMDEYIDGIHLTKITPGEEGRPLTEEEAFEYRSIVGRLNWIAQGARPDKSFSVIELSTKFRKPTLRDLNQAVRIMRKVKEVKSAVHFPELGSSQSLKVFTDAAHGNLPDGFSSTMGLVVFLAGNGRVAPVSWRANKIRRVVKSSLAAEALALQEGVDEAVYIQKMLSEMGLQVSIHAFVDNRNLVEALHSTKYVDDRRLRIDIGALKQSLEREVTAVHWCPGGHQLADSLTKRGADGMHLLRTFQSGRIA